MTEGVTVSGNFVESLMIEVCRALDRIPAYRDADRAARAASNWSGRAPRSIFRLGDAVYRLHHGDYGSDQVSFSWLTLSVYDSLEAAEANQSAPLEYMDLSNDVAISAFGEIDSEHPKIVYKDAEGEHVNDREAVRKSRLLISRLDQTVSESQGRRSQSS